MDAAASAPAEAENIAVCIRVRPMNDRERRANDQPALACVPALNVVSLTDPETGAPMTGKGNVFQYDQIFDAASDSHAIYERVARRIVHSTLGGINGTIFAYGQTSSGKTYTMQGDGGMPFEPEAESCRPGILQLAVEDIFNYIERCVDRDFLLRVSFLEIYNEVVKDLLNANEKGANLKLREDPRKGVYVECKEEIITNYEDIVTLLQTGNQNRTTGQTAMNDKSSRSHSVFRLVIESKEKAESRRHSEEDVNGAVLVASLNLVDLAGSERHPTTRSWNINKSLLTLSRVINSLASSGGRAQNAPFRDSKLTRLLQNSLGGNTRTLIVCCVTPSDRFIEETKSTLQFAARAKDIQTSATVNEVLDDQTQLRRLKREVHELKKLVNSEALSALKAENAALISEKNNKEKEMARLTGLIVSSSSVTKAAVGKKRKQRTRETWGPGDFLANNTKALGSFLPPRKRYSPAKENVDPQSLFRVYEDVDENAAKEAENPAFASSSTTCSSKRTEVGSTNSSKTSSTSYHLCSGAIATRPQAFDVLAEIRSLMVENTQAKLLWMEIGGHPGGISGGKERNQELVTQKTNSQQMAAEELDSLRSQLQTLKLEATVSQQRFDSEKRQLEAVLKTLQSEIPQPDAEEYINLRSRRGELETLVEEMKASQTILQLAVAKRDEEIASLKAQDTQHIETELQSRVKSLEEEKNLLGQKIQELEEKERNRAQLKNIMQEVEQVRSDYERTAQEKEELQADAARMVLENEELQVETERMSEELEASQRQCYEMSETLMEKEHIAKVLKAQLDAKVMTISQMRTKLESLQQSTQVLTTEKDGASEKQSPTEKQDVDNEAEQLRSEVEQLTETLSAVESELAETKERLEASSEASLGHSELKAAFERLQADFDKLKETGSPDESLQQRYDILNEEYKKISEALENGSRERDDCLEELRALESQLMEVSEEKMKLAAAADEQENKLREVEQAASCSSETITTLQAQLEEAKSAIISLEASKAELEQSVENRTMISEQMHHRKAEMDQLQQRFEVESKEREKLRLDVESYEEILSVLRKEAKDSSATIQVLLEKIKKLETNLDSAALTQQQKEKEVATLTDALMRASSALLQRKEKNSAGGEIASLERSSSIGTDAALMNDLQIKLKASQMEAVKYHNKLKARLDKLEKVKMTTDILDIFHEGSGAQKELTQAQQDLAENEATKQSTEQRVVEHKDEELKLLKAQVEELNKALRFEKHKAAEHKAEMREALKDERDKAEHEIQEIQALVKEKMELVEKLEAQLASVKDAMAKKRENVAYLEKENLELHVKTRELKKRMESMAIPDTDDPMGDTGTYDASAAAAAKALGEIMPMPLRNPRRM
ncbi:Kinesin-like protein [Phytophthora cactorum]|nr:Kinesin-like protein [Phytophthora cactorum]